eukprot:TRINITY_DN9457_c0_g11_i2.p1 TRINITY_DN9457_c0_g11~~TRINITY_DN9457_c0_g11_i2.p1  ORF type:complete len:1290 (+),score=366.79 TRINITY_DN9457_c0_g11_i2:99-3968(+)
MVGRGRWVLDDWLAHDGATQLCRSENKPSGGQAGRAGAPAAPPKVTPLLLQKSPRPLLPRRPGSGAPLPPSSSRQPSPRSARASLFGHRASCAPQPTERPPRSMWEYMLFDEAVSKLVRQEVTRLIRLETREIEGRGLPPTGRCTVPLKWVEERRRRMAKRIADYLASRRRQSVAEAGAVTLSSVAKHHENVARQQQALKQREQQARELRRLVRELARDAQAVGPSSKLLEPQLERLQEALREGGQPPPPKPKPKPEPDAPPVAGGDTLFPVPGYQPVLERNGQPLARPPSRARSGVINVYDPPSKWNARPRYLGTFEPDGKTRRFQLLCAAVHGLISVKRLPAHLGAYLPQAPQGCVVPTPDGDALEYTVEELSTSRLELSATRYESLHTSNRSRAAVRELFLHACGSEGTSLDPTAYVSFELDLLAGLMPSFSSRQNIAVAEQSLARLTESGRTLPDWQSFYQVMFDWALLLHSRDDFPNDNSFEHFFASIRKWLEDGGGSDDKYLEALQSRKMERVADAGSDRSRTPRRRRTRKHADGDIARTLLAASSELGRFSVSAAHSDHFSVSKMGRAVPSGHGSRPRGPPAGLTELMQSLPGEYQHCMRIARDVYHTRGSRNTSKPAPGQPAFACGYHSSEETEALFQGFRRAEAPGAAAWGGFPDGAGAGGGRGSPDQAPPQQSAEDELDALLNYLAKRPSVESSSGMYQRQHHATVRMSVASGFTAHQRHLLVSPRSAYSRRGSSAPGSRRGSAYPQRMSHWAAVGSDSRAAHSPTMSAHSPHGSVSCTGLATTVPLSGIPLGDTAAEDEQRPSIWERKVRRLARERLVGTLPAAPQGGPPPSAAALRRYRQRYLPSGALGGGATTLRRLRLRSAPPVSGHYGRPPRELRALAEEAQQALAEVPGDAAVLREADVLAYVSQLRLDGEDRAADAVQGALDMLRALPQRYLRALEQLSAAHAGTARRRRLRQQRKERAIGRALDQASVDVIGVAKPGYSAVAASEAAPGLPPDYPVPLLAERPASPPRDSADEASSGSRSPQTEAGAPRFAPATSRLLGRWPAPPTVPTGPKPSVLGLPTSPQAKSLCRDDGRLEKAVIARARRLEASSSQGLPRGGSARGPPSEGDPPHPAGRPRARPSTAGAALGGGAQRVSLSEQAAAVSLPPSEAETAQRHNPPQSARSGRSGSPCWSSAPETDPESRAPGGHSSGEDRDAWLRRGDAVKDRIRADRRRRLQLVCGGVQRIQHLLRDIGDRAGDPGAFDALQGELAAAQRHILAELTRRNREGAARS